MALYVKRDHYFNNILNAVSFFVRSILGCYQKLLTSQHCIFSEYRELLLLKVVYGSHLRTYV